MIGGPERVVDSGEVLALEAWVLGHEAGRLWQGGSRGLDAIGGM